MSKNLLLPSAFLLDVYRLIALLDGNDLDSSIISLCESLELQITAKLAALDRHDSFTKYKSAPPGSSERESLRRLYLDKAYVHKDWRSDIETFF